MFDLEDFLDAVKTVFEFLGKRAVFITMIVLGAITGYFAIRSINVLPKPETIPELIKYFFGNTEDYMKALGLTLVSSIFVLGAGSTVIYYGVIFKQLHTVIRIILYLLGSAIIITAFYFFGYFLLLLVALLIIFGIAYLFLSSSSSSSSSRRRRY